MSQSDNSEAFTRTAGANFQANNQAANPPANIPPGPWFAGLMPTRLYSLGLARFDRARKCSVTPTWAKRSNRSRCNDL